MKIEIKKTVSNLIHVDFRRKQRVSCQEDLADPLTGIQEVTCKTCPIANHCFWFIRIFKRRLCPFKRGSRK